MWTAGLDLDEEMPEWLASLARGWFSELCDLKKLHIPRCLQENEKMVNTLSLHTFVDSSESAFGAVVYARYSYQDGSISTNIIAAKLANAEYLSFDVRYPVILPQKSWVTKLIIKEHHEQGMHACGTNHTLAA